MPSLDVLLADWRHGFRTLLRNRAFTATAVATFGLCFGANVALFAIVNAVLLRPLPFPAADRLVAVVNSYPKAGVERAGCSVPHFLERRSGIAAFEDAAVWRGYDRTLGDAGSPERVEAMAVSASFFDVIGVRPARGRTFTEREGTEGNNQVVILSDGLWREKFGADPAILGRTVRMDGGTLSTIIGVMPAGFQYLSSPARLWTPLAFSADDQKPDQRHSNNLEMIARLKPGATIAEAQAQIDALNAASLAHDPYAKLVTAAQFHTRVTDLRSDYVAETRPVVLLLQAGVLVLLLIGLVNVTNLLLVRATGRLKELSLRQVLGASSGQLARQLVAETTTLALAGGVIGLGAGWLALRAFALLRLDRLPHSAPIGLDGTVISVALGAAVSLGVLLALPILWHTRRQNVAAALAVESRGGTTSRQAHRLRHALIIAQFALALVLLVSGGLLGLSFARVLAVNPGFDPQHVVTATVQLPRNRYPEPKDRVAFLQRLNRELEAVPGLGALGFGTLLPFGGGSDINAVTVVGHTPAPGESVQAHYMGGVVGGYFAALQVPLRAGRWLTSEDTQRENRVCVVDELVAKRYWPGRSALGQQLFNGVPKPGEQPFTIVGVVGTVKQESLADQRGTGAVYLPYAHYAGRSIALVLRTTVAPATVAAAVRAAVLRADPDMPVAELKSLGSRIDESLAQRRSPLVLAAVFAGFALLLVTVGLYGVLAYTVAQRRREIGVRMALGAAPAAIRRQFLHLGTRLALVGMIIGGIGAWWSGRAMNSLLFGVSPTQPVVFGAAVAVLIAVALIACLVPAVQAARVPPMDALRSE